MNNVGVVVTSRQVNVVLINPSILVDLLIAVLTWGWTVQSRSILTLRSFSTSVDVTVKLFMVSCRCWFLYKRWRILLR